MARPAITAPQTDERRLKMTYDEFLAWADEDVHAEWVDGVVIVFVPPSRRHQDLVLFLGSLLSWYARALNLGQEIVAPFEMRLAPGRSSREPDILFVAQAHSDRLSSSRLNGPADLEVEVVSDSSVARDRADKFYQYQEAGIAEYWVVDPRAGKERVDLNSLTQEGKYQPVLPDGDGRYHSAALPGFWLHPDWLWQEPLPNPLTILPAIAPDSLRTAFGPRDEA